MKLKKFAILTLAALTVASGVLSVSAKDLEIKAAYGTPTIDGKMDKAYSQSQVYEIKYSKDSSYSTGKLYYLWDEKAIYIFADVTDDTPSTKADTSKLANIWKTDCIEFGANLIPSEVGDPHKISKGGVWLAAPLYGDQLDIYGPLNDIESVKNGIKCAMAKTSTGWTVEIMLPVFGDATGIVPKAGEKYGVYSILHNDTNDDNVRESTTTHNSDLTMANKDSAKMDYIVLSAKPAKTAPQTADLSLMALTLSAGAAFVAAKAKRR